MLKQISAKLPPELVAALDAAKDAGRARSRNHAIELACEAWLASDSSTSNEAPDIRAMIEAMDPEQLIALMKDVGILSDEKPEPAEPISHETVAVENVDDLVAQAGGSPQSAATVSGVDPPSDTPEAAQNGAQELSAPSPSDPATQVATRAAQMRAETPGLSMETSIQLAAAELFPQAPVVEEENPILAATTMPLEGS